MLLTISTTAPQATVEQDEADANLDAEEQRLEAVIDVGVQPSGCLEEDRLKPGLQQTSKLCGGLPTAARG